MTEATNPVFQTKQFDIFRMTCKRNPATGLPPTCTWRFFGIRTSHVLFAFA